VYTTENMHFNVVHFMLQFRLGCENYYDDYAEW